METRKYLCLPLYFIKIVFLLLLVNFTFFGQTKQNHQITNRLLTTNAPATYDWRNHTSFTQVKNSGMCGASQAFVTAAFFEQEIVSAGLSNNSINLSEMYLMSCNPQNSGCSSSPIETLLDFVIQKGGIPKESQYPYNPSTIPSKICFEKSLFQIPNVSRASYYELKDPQKIKVIIYKKPAIAAVCGTGMTSYFPNASDPASRTLRCSPHNRVRDHHVLLIGYTETQWIVKNSWGSDWGLNGYAYISKTNAQDCCIGDQIHTTGLITAYCTVANCQTCVDGYSCSTCMNGSYLSYNIQTGEKTCVTCMQLNCQECYNYKGTCKWCTTGYAINMTTNKCAFTVISNCNRISNDACVQCKPGYNLSADGLRCNVNCQVANCQSCPQGACLSCKAGYNFTTQTINGKQIQVCNANTCSVTNCLLCSSTGSCITCKPGFALNSTSSQCYSNCTITDCLSCSNSTNYCNICVDGKSWNQATNACETYSSTSNCKQFDNACLSCKAGYQLDLATNPFQCSQICDQESCSQCLINDLSSCVTCKDGYALNVTTYSSRCQKNPCSIINCTLCSSDGSQCLKCTNQLFVFNSTSNNCENQCAIANCKYCLPTDSVCSNCSDGYVFNTDNLACVVSNIANCVQAYYAGVGTLEQYCLKCQQNYAVLKTAQSFDQQCILQCQVNNCQSCNEQMTYVCLQCIDETYPKLINGTLQCSYSEKYFQNCAFPSLNQSHCFECKQFYFLNLETGLCELNTQNCPSTCEYCTPSDYNGGFSCKCKNSLFFNKVTNQCIPNPFNDTNCIAGSLSSSYSYCSTCNQGMSVNYTSWKSCVSGCNVQNCKFCAYQSYMTCSVCNQGYYLNNELGCTQCTINDTNCENCILAQCLSCKAGYHLASNGMRCILAQCNGNQIYDGLNCVCPSGTYYITNQACSNCNQPNCNSCSNDSCFLCDLGYYLSSNECLNCIPNCKICTDSTTNCTQCNEGYFFDSSTQQCFNLITVPRLYNVTGTFVTVCPLNCLACTQQALCTQCSPNYHNIAGMCYGCQNNCKTCYRSNLTTCLSCFIGYHLTNRKNCIKCADSNCKDCTISSQVCISCKNGFSLANGTCTTCSTQIDGCAQCNDIGQCTKCSSGYALMSDFTCQQCGCNCRSCNSTAINQCFVECNTTSYLSNNTCVSCPSQCKTCTSASVCLSCSDGYVYKNGQCIKPCSTGCYECDQSNSSKCIMCFNSYTLLGNGTCSASTTCNSDTSCTFCSDNWILINGACQPCMDNTNCSQCSQKNTSFCIACKQGFYSSNGSCIQCSQSCQLCFGSQRCDICKDGYFKPIDTIISNCIRCSSICKTCIDGGEKCTSCYDGFYLAVTDKCLTVTKIEGTIKLNVALSSFITASKSIRKAILTCIGSIYENDTKQYIITKLQEGSVILSFTISIPDGLNQAQTYSTFKTNLANLNQISGISVISVGQINLVNKTDNSTDEKQDPFIDPSLNSSADNTKKLAIILGVSIPGAIIILVLIFCIIRKKFSNRRVIIQEQIQIKDMSQDQKSQHQKSYQCVTLQFASQSIKRGNSQELFVENNSVISQQSHDRLSKMNANNKQTTKVFVSNKKSLFRPETKSRQNNDNLNIIKQIPNQPSQNYQ